MRTRRLLGRARRAVGRARARLRGGSASPILPIPRDADPRVAEIIEAVQPYSLTSPDRIMGLCAAVRYIERAGIPGAIVECGVWRGGSMMAAALSLLDIGATDRELFMFDTFDVTQIPVPSEHDVSRTGEPVAEAFVEAQKGDHGPFASLPVDRVKELVAGTGYPEERLNMVVGLVEETLPQQAPEPIALCRLDTDFYESTAVEMRELFPRIAPGGVVIVDDYGDFPGCRKAVDEYLEQNGIPLLLTRLDASGRLAVVPPRTG